MQIEKTEGYCCSCRTYHYAEIIAKENIVLFVLHCPVKEISTVISKDASLFIELRKKSFFDSNKNILCDNSRIRLNRIELTDSCNFHCSLCYAGASSDKNYFLPIEKCKEIAVYLKQVRASEAIFTGGEPTLHPELGSIISLFKRNGMRTGILTNGYLFAKNSLLAKQLKQKGLRRCYIQLDTFDKSLHKKMRGNDFVDEKIQALANAKQAKLKVSSISVMIKDNLSEIGKILNHIKILTPHFGEAVFLSAIRDSGRYTLPNDAYVDREEIIQAFVTYSGIKNIGTQNFWPLPRYLPIGLNVHPDCCTLLYLVFNRNDIELLDDYIDMEKFYFLLAQNKKKTFFILDAFKALLYFARSIKKGKVFIMLKILCSYLTGKGNRFIHYVMIESFVSKEYQDVQRLRSCITHHVTGKNLSCSACIFNQDFESGRTLTRYSTEW
jgi:uncharacterized radical SAM superfamily Fe-S cluster-containing enzyme